MSKSPPRYFIQKQVCCNQKLAWVNCGHRAGTGCPDCGGAGGWWQECGVCGEQPYGESLFKDSCDNQTLKEVR